MSLGLIAPVYNEVVRAYKHFTLLNGSPVALEFLLDPAVTGVSLETWLSTPANLTQLQQLISAPSGAAAMCASGTAMTAVAASSTAMAAVVASSTAMAAVVASSTAMTAVAASSTAMTAVAASSTAMAAVAASSTAMAAVAASSTAMAAVAASSTAMTAVFGSGLARTAIYDSSTAWGILANSASAKAYMTSISTTSNTASTTHIQVNTTKRSVLLQQKISNPSYSSHAGASANTYSTTSNTFLDRFAKVTGLSHATSSSFATSTITWISME